jgi:phenylpyruvate tautomerase PptA (4-oxalocrotonate tautomerase family)
MVEFLPRDSGTLHAQPAVRKNVMPLITINVIAGRSDDEIQGLLDAAHRAMVATFNVPERDRYQIVHEIPPSRFIAQDTGLGIPRTDKFVLFEVTTRPRTREQKEAFYARLSEELEQQCGIEPTDVMVAMTQNTDEDWSFGNGRAQFLTGEL